MILVDSSVWIDYINGVEKPHTDSLHRLLGEEQLLMGDLILAEVLQGFQDQRTFNVVRSLLTSLEIVSVCDPEVAIQAANNLRTLRRLGVTVRKTIDTIIATRCIADGYELLHNDRDFDPFVKHLGLKVVT